MRFLVDQCLAAEVADGLAKAGHDAVHTSAYGLGRAADPVILARAVVECRVVISGETDFGGLLASQQAAVVRAACGGPEPSLPRRSSGL